MNPRRVAEDAARALKRLERMRGILRYQDAALWLREPSALPSAPRHRVDARALATWSHALRKLPAPATLDALTRGGQRALRRFQGLDFAPHLEALTSRYAQLNALSQMARHHAALMPYLVSSLERGARDDLAEALSSWRAVPVELDDSSRARLTVVAGFCDDLEASAEERAAPAFRLGQRARTQAELSALAAATPDLGAATRLDALFKACGTARELERVASRCARFAHLHGGAAAEALLRDATESLRAEVALRRALLARLGAAIASHFPDLVRRRDQERARLATLHGELATLDASLSARLPSKSELGRWAQAQRAPDAERFAHALQRVIVDALALRCVDAARWDEALSGVEAIMRHHPGVSLPGVSELPEPYRARLAQLAAALPREIWEGAWPMLREMRSSELRDGFEAFLTEKRPTVGELALLRRSSSLRAYLKELPAAASSRRALFEQLELLERHGALEWIDKPHTGWLPRLHASPLRARDALATVTLARALHASEWQGDLLKALPRASTLDTRLEAMRDPSLVRAAHGPAITRCAALFPDEQRLGVEESLERLFHAQSLLGEPVGVSNQFTKAMARADVSAALAQLDQAIASARTRRDESTRIKLEQRRAEMERPGGYDHAAQAARRRAANLIERLATQTWARCLSQRIDEATLDTISDLTGLRLSAEAMTPALLDALAYIDGYAFDAALFERLLRTALGPGTRDDLEENAAWLAVAAHHERFSLKAWRRGFSERLTIEGEGEKERWQGTARTEHDLLVAVQMGTWFRTCTSLRTGSEASSALARALESSTYVVYIEDDQGRALGRKLISITREFGLIGHPLYVTDRAPEKRALTEALEGAIARFAFSCGLTLVGGGERAAENQWTTSEELYFDDPEAWHQHGDASETDGVPAPWAHHVESRLQWCLARAMARDDIDELCAIMRRARWPYEQLAAARLIKIGAHDAVMRWASQPGARSRWNLEPQLSRAVERSAHLSVIEKVDLYEALFVDTSRWRPLEQGLLFFDGSDSALFAEVTRRAAEVLDDARGASTRSRNTLEVPTMVPSVLLATLPFEVLFAFIESVVLSQAFTYDLDDYAVTRNGYLNSTYLEALQVALFRAPNAQALSLVVDTLKRARHPAWLTLLAQLAAQITPQGVALQSALWHHARSALRRPGQHAYPLQRRALRDALLAPHGVTLSDDEHEQLDGVPIQDTNELLAAAMALRQRGAPQERAVQSARRDVIRALSVQADTPRAKPGLPKGDARDALCALADLPYEGVEEILHELFALAGEPPSSALRTMILSRHRQHRAEARAPDVFSAPWVARLTHGERSSRLEALREEIARDKGSSYCGTSLWMLCSDLRGELDDEEIAQLAGLALPYRRFFCVHPYCMRTALAWVATAHDVSAVTRAWLDGVGNTLSQIEDDDLLLNALLVSLDDEARGRAAAATFEALDERVEAKTRVFLFGLLRASDVSGAKRVGDLIAERLIRSDTPIAPAALIESCLGERNPADASLTQADLAELLERAAGAWGDESIEQLAALITEHAASDAQAAFLFESLFTHSASRS